jgi:hypothetical protein
MTHHEGAAALHGRFNAAEGPLVVSKVEVLGEAPLAKPTPELDNRLPRLQRRERTHRLLSAAILLAGCSSRRYEAVLPSEAPLGAAASATAVASAAPPDWMWTLVGVGTSHEVFWRWPDGTCESWRIEPEGFPANYRGKVSHGLGDDGGQVQFAYEGGQPALSDLLVARDKLKVPWPCKGTDEGDWYVDAAACAHGGPAPLHPAGCFAAAAPAARAAMTQALSGDAATELRNAIARARRVWTSNGCTKRKVRTVRSKLYMNDSYLYSTAVTWSGNTVTLAEEATHNPDYTPPADGGESVAMGCCSGPDEYFVLSFENGAAQLEKTSRGAGLEAWYVGDSVPASVHCN